MLSECKVWFWRQEAWYQEEHLSILSRHECLQALHTQSILFGKEKESGSETTREGKKG